MLQKVLTGLNEDSSEFTIEVHEQLNEFVAASFIDAPVVAAAVYADEGGMLYVVVSFGGPGVPVKRAEFEKELADEELPPEERKASMNEAFAESKQKAKDDKAKAEAKAKQDKAKAELAKLEADKKALAAAAAGEKAKPKAEEEDDESKKQPVGAGARSATPAKEPAKEPPKHGR